MLSAFGVDTETTTLPCNQPEMGGVADSPPKTGASWAWFCWTSVLAKTRSQGPFCSTITISRPAEMVSSRCELVSASTKTGVSRRTVASRPEGGLSAARAVAGKAMLAQKRAMVARGTWQRGGFTCSEYAASVLYEVPSTVINMAGSALPPLMMATAGGGGGNSRRGKRSAGGAKAP